MAKTQSKEARAIVRRLLKAVIEDNTLSPDRSKNELKASRRALGALLFTPDDGGYIDIVEKGLTAGRPPKNILKSIATASEKYVKSFSIAPGTLEAHHVIALSSLRDNFMSLPETEQDKFLDMLQDGGWELGDTEQQLSNTVQTRPAHIKQDPIHGKGAEKFKGQSAGLSGTQVSHGTPSGSVPTNNPNIVARGATNADELMGQFRRISQPQVLQALKGNLTDDNVRRAVFEMTDGYVDLYNADPKAIASLLETDVDEALDIAAQAGQVRPSAADVARQAEGLVPGISNPDYVPSSRDMEMATMGLGGYNKKAFETIAGILRPIVNNPIVGQTTPGKVLRASGALLSFGADAVQAKEGVTEATTSTNKLKRTAGELEVLGAGMGLGGFVNPLTSFIPGLAAQHLRKRAQRQEEAEMEVQAIEGTRPAPVLEETPQVVKTKRTLPTLNQF